MFDCKCLQCKEEKKPIHLIHQTEKLSYIDMIRKITQIRIQIPEICIFSNGDIEYCKSKLIKKIPFNRLKKTMSIGPKLIKYIDQNTQLISEQEYIQLISKVRADHIWSQILYIQSFQDRNYIRFTYHPQTVNQILYNRAEIEIAILNREIVKAMDEYITTEQEILFERSLPNIQEYLSYKIIHYFRKILMIEICQGVFEWSDTFLIGINHVDYRQILNQIDKEPSIEINRTQYTQNDEIVQLYQQIMSNEYRKKKQELGLNEQTFQINRDEESEILFNEIYEGQKSYADTFKDASSYARNESSLLIYLKNKFSRTRPRLQQQTPEIPNIRNQRPRSFQITRKRTISRDLKRSANKPNTLSFMLQF
ncbi:hypothetical protein pb186bvf_000689 [Paramecium bursaria]